MEDKQLKKIKRYLEDVIDGRDDLLQCTEKLVSTASLQVEALLHTQVSPLQKKALLTFLTKAIVLFTELNHTVFKFIESEPLPKISENVQICKEPENQEQMPLIQDLCDFFKANLNESSSTLDFSTSGPKVPNNQVVNDTYVRKPLDDTTLKAICLANSNISEANSDTVPELKPVIAVDQNVGDNIAANNSVDPVDRSSYTKSLIQEHHEVTANTSPTFSTFSESEIFSTVSSVAYQHPLIKFRPPTEIPKQYDTHDLQQIKENLAYLSKKMGFDPDKLNQMQNHFTKKANFEYEEPVKEIQEEREIRNKDTTAKENNTEPGVDTFENTGTDQKVLHKLYNDLAVSENTTINNENVEAGPSTSTGAIRKQKMPAEDLIEFSASASDSESCEKVNTWLNNNPLSGKSVLDSTESNTSEELYQNSAIDKLNSVKRHNRNEEAREEARKDMPDIKFVPVEVPKVIRNDLHSEDGKNVGKKKKAKDLNKENGVYEIKKMELPEVGGVCVFSHIVSPSEFYVQIVNDISTGYLDEIVEKLDLRFRRSEPVFKTKREAFEKLGKFCFGYVMEEKMGWYRLQVLDWELGCPSPDVKVKSVDCGFICRTSYQCLRELSKDLAHIPMLAIQCHFPLLYPPGSTYSNRLTEWPQMTIDSLYDLANLHSDTDSSNFKMFQITLAMLEGESLAVDLIQFNEPNVDSFRDTLLDIGLAVDMMEDYGDHPELGEFFEDVNELENTENLNELVLGYDAKDEMRICRFTRKDGTCYKGKNCKLEHIILKDGYTTDKVTAFYTAINDPIFPVKGETIRVLVTAYIDSCTYLVQVVRNPVAKENTNLTMDRDISELMDAINHPKKILKYENFKVYPAMGEVVLAYHSLSKVWMRVVVRELKYTNNGNVGEIEVHAVDFGDQFTVKLKDVRVMLEEFLHVPFQVKQIYLDNYQHRLGCDKKKAKRFFDKHIFYKNFLIYVKSNEAPLKVSMTTFTGREIGPTLVNHGVAEKRTMDILIAEGSKMDLY